MSKRLRSPLRTTLRGRSLRPRSSQPRLDATETGGFDDAVEMASANDGDRLSPEPSILGLDVAAPIPVEQTPLPAPVTAAPEPIETVAPLLVSEPAVEAPIAVPIAAATHEPVAETNESEPDSMPPVDADAAAPPPTVRERAMQSDRPHLETAATHRSADDGEQAEPHPERSEPRDEPARQPALPEDELSTSLSLSSEFFRQEEDSVPPFLAEEELDEPLRVEPASPATLRRRRAFRGVVGTVITLVGLCAVAVVGKTIATRPASASTPVAVPVARVQQMPTSRLATALGGDKPTPPAAAAEAAAPEKPEPAAAAPADEPAKTEAPAPATDAPAAEAKQEAAKPEEAAKPAGDGKELRKEALALLNRGKAKDAIPVARAAISADPAEAMGYLYLGSALQDSGKWKDGIEAYSECVRNATKGPVHECRAMGGKK